LGLSQSLLILLFVRYFSFCVDLTFFYYYAMLHIMKQFDTPLDTAIETANQLHRSCLRLSRVLHSNRTSKRVSLPKLSVLGLLYRNGVTTATELAAYLGLQPQSLTRLIADLERRRLITRRADNADRRKILLKLTDAGGKLLLDDIRGQRTKLAQTVAKTLTPAEQGVLRLAAGLMDRLAEAAGPAGSKPSAMQVGRD
jgi:DNA-binding MarR family transcriptional regulator